MADNTNAALNSLLQHCIAEATAELGPELLDPSKIYADMARRILAAILGSDLSGPKQAQCTCYLADGERVVRAEVIAACPMHGNPPLLNRQDAPHGR